MENLVLPQTYQSSKEVEDSSGVLQSQSGRDLPKARLIAKHKTISFMQIKHH